MPFNVKVYLVIGLVGVAAFCMHKSSMQDSTTDLPVEFESVSGEFQPLSSIDETVGSSISSADLIEIDSSVLHELSGEILDNAQQTRFEIEPEPDTTNNDFDAPELVEASDEMLELASELSDFSITSDEGPTNSFDSDALVADSATLELVESQIDMAAELVSAKAPEIKRHHQRPNSRWKGNPFLMSDAPAQTINGSADTELARGDTNEPFKDSFQAMLDASKPAPGGFQSNPFQSNEFVAESTKQQSVLIGSESTAPATIIEPSVAETTIPLKNQGPNFGDQRIAPVQIAIPAAIAQQAAQHIEYGKSLSRRGAAFAARQEFFSALQLIAQSNDATTGGNEYSLALTQGILALKEAKGFANKNSEAEILMDVAMVVETHRSNILDVWETKSLTPNQAMQSYLSYARQKLDLASGRNVVAAEAFYCLGKLHTAIASNQATMASMDMAKAVVFHQAALLSDQNHYRSANELGVLLTRTGQLEKAVDLFKQSLTVRSTPNTWRNLAKTHRRLGQQDLAQLAETEFAFAANRRVTNATAGIRWMPTSQFNDSAPMEHNERIASQNSFPAVQQTNSKVEQPRNKSLGERLKDLF